MSPASASKSPTKVNVPDIPDEQKVVLGFDSCALMALAVPREDKVENPHTYLDMIRLTAELPTVKKIVIPATVADWELRHSIMLRRGDQSELYAVPSASSHSPKTAADKAINELLDEASRCYVGDDGKYHFIPGKNPKIVIYETPFDHKVRKAIIDIIDDTSIPDENVNKFISITLKEMKEGSTDIGEKSLEEYCKTVPEGCPAYLITRDLNYLKNRNRWAVTPSGHPIGEAQVYGYIEAELLAQKSSKSKFKALLDKNYGGDTAAHELRPILQRIDDFGRSGFRETAYAHDEGYPHSTPGQYLTEEGHEEGESLVSILGRGVALANYGQAQFTQAPPFQEPKFTTGELTMNKENGTPRNGTKRGNLLAQAVSPLTATSLISNLPEPPDVGFRSKAVLPPGSKGAEVTTKRAAYVAMGKAYGSKPTTDETPPAEQAPATAESVAVPEEVAQVACAPTPTPVSVAAPTGDRSFGFRIGEHRVERGMSESDMAKAINNQLTAKDDITAQHVHKWETSRALPEGDVLATVVHLLVDENERITDKEAARKKLAEAYAAAEVAIKKGYLKNKDIHAFGDKLFEFRDAHKMTESDFADAINKHLKPSELVTTKMVFNVEHGTNVPSFGLVRALIRAIHEKTPLSEEQREELFAAYKQIKPRINTQTGSAVTM